MEKCIMKITKLEVKKLYGYSDYSVDFNNDVTFLYGENGCGKTTILNIITYIITGKIYELFSIKFEEISLYFYSVEYKRNSQLSILSTDGMFKVKFFDEQEEIILHNLEYMFRSGEEKEEIDRFYFSEYPLLDKIRKAFNYVYLPLNRNGNIGGADGNLGRMTQMRYGSRRSVNGIDVSLREVDNLVRGAYNRVNFVLNQISEKFSDDLLKSFLDIENILTFEKVVEYMQKLNEVEIRKLQQEYTNALMNMNRWEQETEKKINAFFDSLIQDIKSNSNSSELIFKISELSKISTVISKAEKSEQDKKKNKQPIDDFIKTVNLFISGKKTKKEIYIDTDGTVYLRTAYAKKIDIQHLSSGEKQIVTFFAYLIFGLEKTKQSIFIVDEPELSLHLNWQRQFVDAIMHINPNVQLIFATHAPEMIGRHREKAVKLIPSV